MTTPLNVALGCLSLVVVLAGAPWVRAADSSTPARRSDEPAALTPDQRVAVDSLDVMLAGFNALLVKIDDPDYRATTEKILNALTARREVLRKNYEQGFYNDLKLDLYHEYQRTALWLAPLRTPPPAHGDNPKGSAMVPRDANQTALVTLDWQIRALEERSRRRGGKSPEEEREIEDPALKSIKERRAALAENFTREGYNALVAEIEALGPKRLSDVRKQAPK